MLYWLLKVLLTPVFFVVFRTRVHNGAVVRPGAVILAANHQSFCDSLFIPAAVRRRVTYLAKAEYFDDPKQAWFYRGVGQIPIRRGGGDRVPPGARDGGRRPRRGRVIALYPRAPPVMSSSTGAAPAWRAWRSRRERWSSPWAWPARATSSPSARA